MEPNGSWDIDPNNCEVDFKGELQSSLDDLDIEREECEEYMTKFNKAKRIIVKLKAQIEESRGCKDKLKMIEDEIFKLKSKKE